MRRRRKLPARRSLVWRAPLLLLALVLGVIVSSVGHGGASRLASRAPMESGPALGAGVAHHRTEFFAPRTHVVLVAATPLLERSPALPARPTRLAGARLASSSFDSLKPLDRAHVTVVRWRRHVPRMDTGEPPRRGPLVS